MPRLALVVLTTAVLTTAVLTTACATIDRHGLGGGGRGSSPVTVTVIAVPSGTPLVEASTSTAVVGSQALARISIEQISGTIGDLDAYDIAFPEVSGTASDDVINSTLRSIAEEDAAWFVTDVSKGATVEEEITDEEWEDVASELSLVGTVTHVDDWLLGVRFERY